MIKFRYATIEDVNLFYQWANDPSTRENSYEKNKIEYDQHVEWFKNKLNSEQSIFYLFENDEQELIGQVRIDIKAENEALVNVSVDLRHRKKGYGALMIDNASNDFLFKHSGFKLLAYIFKNNYASYHSFLKAGYIFFNEQFIKNTLSYVLYKV